MSKSSLHHGPITRAIRERDTDSIVKSLKQDSKTTVEMMNTWEGREE